MPGDPISFWLSDGFAWIRPAGQANALNAPQVKAFAREMIQRGCQDFAVDLGACTILDETFMGTLAGCALRLRELGRGKLHILSCPPELETQLTDLGLEQLFEM